MQVVPNCARASPKPVCNLLGSDRLVLNDPQDTRPHGITDCFELLNRVDDKPRWQLRHSNRHIIWQHRNNVKIVFPFQSVHWLSFFLPKKTPTSEYAKPPSPYLQPKTVTRQHPT